MTWDVSTDTVDVEFTMATETPIAADWGEIGGTLSDQTDLQTALNAKQDTIADLSTIRSGASAGATAYQKPASGIPSTDMATAVQTSLGKADSALQDAPSDNKQYARKNGAWAEVEEGSIDHRELTNRDASNQHPISAIQGLQAALDAKGTYSKPANGIPATDLTSAVQGMLHTVTVDPDGNVDSIDSKDIAAKYDSVGNDITTEYATKAESNSKYSKPASGIPSTDLTSAVQTSLGKADSALQSVPDTYRTSAAQDVIDAGKASTSDIPTIEWVS